MAHSWDFWDTLVTRCVLTPAEVFDIVEQISGVNGFAAARKTAEAKSRAGVSETTLDRIYDFLPYDAHEKQLLRTTEIRVEALLASPIMANAIQCKLEDVVISDMYLDRPTMLQIAASCGINLHAENMYLSSDSGATKHTGELFDYVQKNVMLKSHVGDNYHSDYLVPARKGIRATQFIESPATPTEREWARLKSPNANLIAGLLRATRLSEPPAAGYRNGEWILYSQIVAPLLLLFVDWTLRQCEQRGIENIFFMARDGQILHRITSALLNARGGKIRAHYLYASRQALHLPGHVSMEQSASWIADNTAKLSLRVIAGRINVDADSIATIARRYIDAEIDENLSPSQRSRLPAVLNDVEFVKLVNTSSERSIESAASYLRQIGLLNPTYQKVGIVDVGWIGRVQRSLEGISVKVGVSPERIHGFYLGLASECVHLSGERITGMLADPFRTDADVGEPWINSHKGMIEFFLRANHPTTVGYMRDDNDLFAPIFGAHLSESEIQEIERKQEAIMAFVNRYCRVESLIGAGLAEALRPAEMHMRRLLERPTRDEASVFLAHRHSEQQIEKEFTPIVCPPSLFEVFKSNEDYRFGMWPEGSHALSAVPWLFRLRRSLSQSRWRNLFKF